MFYFLKKLFLKDFKLADRVFKFLKLLPSFVVKNLINLLFLFPQKKSNFPHRLTIFLTDKCNMKCAHCFIIKEAPKKTIELSTEDYKKLFKSLEGKTSQILFTGGEPTLRKDFYEILYSSYHDGGVSTASIFSNALYPDKTHDLIKKVLETTNLNIHLHTSIDGNEAFHDDNRKVKGSYGKVVQTINLINELEKKFKNRLSRVVVNVSISKMNKNHLADVVKTFKNLNCLFGLGFTRENNKVLNINEKYITQDLGVEELRQDGSEKFKDSFLTPGEMKKIYNDLGGMIWDNDSDQLIYAFQKSSMLGRINFEESETSPISTECGMGYDDLVILTNGKIARCEMLKPSLSLYDFDLNLQKLINSNENKNYLKETSGCFCEHECAISVTAMSDKKLLKNFFA
ncbi:radical SAM protein [Pelagibacteraceae bacterium]|nr:radical SAM protein [Pelagibacteraceae bacterium]